MSKELDNICYLCLSNDKNLIYKNINAKDADGIFLKVKLKNVVPECVRFAPKIDKYICINCIESVNSLYQFKQNCLKNIKLLEDYLQKQVDPLLTDNVTNSPEMQFTYVLIDMEKPFSIVNDYFVNPTENVIVKEENSVITAEEENLEIKQLLNNDLYNMADENNTQGDQLAVKQEHNYFKGILNDLLVEKEAYSIIDKGNEAENVNKVATIEKVVDNLEPSDDEKITEIDERETRRKKRERERPYQCHICGRRFGRGSLLKDHYTVHSDARPHKCKVCDRTFKMKRYLREHMDIHSGVRRYKCQICSKTFVQASVFGAHKRLHRKKLHPEPPAVFECTSCDVKYKSRSNLENHKLTHRQIKCTVCNTVFTHRKYYDIHMKRHISDGTYIKEKDVFSCDACPKKFSYKANLKRHKRIHTNTRPYECPCCKKAFFYSNNLKEHLRIHTGDKPYQCATCGKRFAQSGDLSKHTKLHSEDQRFQCEICPYKSARSDYLKRHMRTHTGEKRYSCKYCQKPFSKMDNMKAHVKKIHEQKT